MDETALDATPEREMILFPTDERRGDLTALVSVESSPNDCGCGCAECGPEAADTEFADPFDSAPWPPMEDASADLEPDVQNPSAHAPATWMDEPRPTAVADPVGLPVVDSRPPGEHPYALSTIPATLRDAVIEDMLRLWGPPPTSCGEIGGGGTFAEDFYGDGSDGDAEYVGGYTALGRDMFYNNLTLGADGLLWTSGFRVFVKRKLTIASTGEVSANGFDGDQGASVNRLPFTAINGDVFLSGNGGAVVASGTSTGTVGAGGAGDAVFKARGPLTMLPGCGGGGGAYVGSAAGATQATDGLSSFGADGGAGGAAVQGSNPVQLSGGHGGGGGGVLLLFAREIDNAGKIRCDGGKGAVGVVSGDSQSGAGGGGGGGALVVHYTVVSGSGLGTVQALGGAGGAVGGTAVAGSDGVVRTYQVKV